MCSSYDWSSGAREELIYKVAPHLDELNQNAFCAYLFGELDIGS